MMEYRCTECGRVATCIVNGIAPVCEYHAAEASLNGWLVRELDNNIEDYHYYKTVEEA